MSVYDQIVTSFSDTTPHIRCVSDVISMLTPRDTPMLARLGIDSAHEKFKIKPFDGTKIELLEDDLPPLSDTAAQGTTITTTATVITVTDGSIFKIGHVVRFDSEDQVVKSVDKTNNKITLFNRTHTTATVHGSTVTVYIVGMARVEGTVADYGPIVDITAPYNYTSILEEALMIAGTMQAISQYGIEDEFAYQADKKMDELLRLLELNALNGVRKEGSATTVRNMGGLGTFITDNTVSMGSSTITKAKIDELAEEIYMDGGYPDILMMNPRVANDVRDILDNSSFIRIDQEETKLGMRPVERIITQYGDLEILMNRHMGTDKAWMLDSSRIGFYTLRPFHWKMLGADGDREKGEVVGEFSLLVSNDKAHGYIQDITT
jgi:hypothetical protein